VKKQATAAHRTNQQHQVCGEVGVDQGSPENRHRYRTLVDTKESKEEDGKGRGDAGFANLLPK
jgi:hypothetical protein